MYTGKTLFAQIMDFLPWSTFHRIVTRYGGDHRIRTFRRTEQFRILAFAQLTYRESLRDKEDTDGIRPPLPFYGFRGMELWGQAGYIVDGFSYPNSTDPGYIPCCWEDLGP